MGVLACPEIHNLAGRVGGTEYGGTTDPSNTSGTCPGEKFGSQAFARYQCGNHQTSWIEDHSDPKKRLRRLQLGPQKPSKILYTYVYTSDVFWVHVAKFVLKIVQKLIKNR